MESIYKILFEVRLWHDYFLKDNVTIPNESPPEIYKASDLFEVVPTTSTRKLLARHRCLFKTTDLGFKIIVEVKEKDDEFETIVPFNSSLKMSFVLGLKDPFFLNYTNLPFENHSSNIYYSNNLEKPEMTILNTQNESLLYLTNSMDQFADVDVDSLEVGDMVKEGETIYEVIKLPIIFVPDPNDDNQEEWKKLNKNANYVTRKDAIKLEGNSFLFEGISPLGSNPDPDEFQPFEVYNIFGDLVKLGYKDYLVNGEKSPIEMPIFPMNGNDLLQHVLRLNNLPSGKYTIDFFNNTITELYHLDPLEFSSPFYAIELFHLVDEGEINVPDDYAFIEIEEQASGEKKYLIRPKIFHIQFRNRSTIWKYISSKDGTQEYEEERPRELTKAYQEIISDDGKVIPNPSVKNLNIDDTGTSKVYTSIIYL